MPNTTTMAEQNTEEEHPHETFDQEEVPPVVKPKIKKERVRDDEAWMVIRNLNQVPASLIGWNVIAAIFQVFQSLLLFALSSQTNGEWYLYTNYPLTLDDADEDLYEFRRPNPDELASYNVVWYSAVFILLSGIDHFACFYFRSKYIYYLERNQNPFRWVEFALSASLLRVMIAQICGVTDVHLLLLIYVCATCTMILGSIHESVNAKARADGYKINWYPFLAAWIPHLASWFVIFNYFFKAVSVSNPPGSIWAIIFILFTLDNIFAVLFYMQWAGIGPYKDFVWAEKEYIVLSFTAKTTLAWIQFGWSSRS